MIPPLSADGIERLLAPTGWPALAYPRIERRGSLEVAVGLVGDWHVARWYRDGFAVKVRTRKKATLGPVVDAIDAGLGLPLEVEATEQARGWPSPGPERDRPHVDPQLEALLPAEVMGAPTARMSHGLQGWTARARVAIERAGFDPRGTRRAWAGGPEHITLQLISVPGATANALEALAVEVGSHVPDVPSTNGEVGDRAVRWQKANGWTTVTWVRDGLVCSVAGHASWRLFLEAIDLMP